MIHTCFSLEAKMVEILTDLKWGNEVVKTSSHYKLVSCALPPL